MEYKVGQKLEHKHTGRIATIVHIHNEYRLVSYEDSSADLFTATDLGVLYKPYRDPIDGAAICWVEAAEPSDSDNPFMGWFGIYDIAKTQCRRCNTKVRITVEEITK